MRKLLLFTVLSFCQFTIAAENDLPAQDADQQDVAQVELDSNQATQEDSDLIVAEILDTNEDEESSIRFIPTEEISQDFGVSFPVDI